MQCFATIGQLTVGDKQYDLKSNNCYLLGSAEEQHEHFIHIAEKVSIFHVYLRNILYDNANILFCKMYVLGSGVKTPTHTNTSPK